MTADTATAGAPPVPDVIPLDVLSKRLERAITRYPRPDKRHALLRRIKAGPEYPVPATASELSREHAALFARQVVASLGPDEPCVVPRSEAASCDPVCEPCKDHLAERGVLLGMIADEMDALEAELAGTTEPEPESPDPARWYVFCQQDGERFLTSSKLARYCSDACRKRAQRADQARKAAQASQEDSPGVRELRREPSRSRRR